MKTRKDKVNELKYLLQAIELTADEAVILCYQLLERVRIHEDGSRRVPLTGTIEILTR